MRSLPTSFFWTLTLVACVGTDFVLTEILIHLYVLECSKEGKKIFYVNRVEATPVFSNPIKIIPHSITSATQSAMRGVVKRCIAPSVRLPTKETAALLEEMFRRAFITLRIANISCG